MGLDFPVTHFLKVGATILSGSAFTRNLNKENKRNGDFRQDNFKANTVECL